MERLPINVKKYGFNHTQIWRNNFAAIYEKWDKSKTHGYEVFEIKKKPQHKIFDKAYPPKEIYPSSENFGTFAWFVPTIERANDYVIEITKRVNERKEKAKPIPEKTEPIKRVPKRRAKRRRGWIG